MCVLCFSAPSLATAPSVCPPGSRHTPKLPTAVQAPVNSLALGLMLLMFIYPLTPLPLPRTRSFCTPAAMTLCFALPARRRLSAQQATGHNTSEFRPQAAFSHRGRQRRGRGRRKHGELPPRGHPARHWGGGRGGARGTAVGPAVCGGHPLGQRQQATGTPYNSVFFVRRLYGRWLGMGPGWYKEDLCVCVYALRTHVRQ